MTIPEFSIRRSLLAGDTADVYYQRTLTILRNEGVNPVVFMEFSASRRGVLCGLSEVKALLSRILPDVGSEVWALEEGEAVDAEEVALRIKAPYGSLGLYETAITGMLASSTGWATAASECSDAAQGTPVLSTAARHVHPNVAAEIDYASVIGGCASCSTIQGARLAGVTPAGNMPHTLPLLLGDTIKAAQAFDRHMPHEVPRIVLVDTFRDEAEESLNTARSLRERLRGVRLDTPKQRGGVTADMVKEIRSRLDHAGFRHVEIMVSGGMTPHRIGEFVASGAPVDQFGVGTYIASAHPNSFGSHIHEIDGRPVAKRGRVPGLTPSPRLDRVM